MTCTKKSFSSVKYGAGFITALVLLEPDRLLCTEIDFDCDTDERCWGGVNQLRKISYGAFGSVYDTNQGTIVKRIFLDEERRIPRLGNEINILKSLPKEYYDLMSIEHENCWYYISYLNQTTKPKTFINSVKAFIVMDKKAGALNKVLQKNLGYSNQIMWQLDIAFKITRAVSHLHTSNIVHRDLKPENIILNEDISHLALTPILTDFDMSLPINTNDGRDGGTPFYNPPEVTKRTFFTDKQDIYSLGKLFFVLMNYSAFTQKTNNDLPLCSDTIWKGKLNPFYCNFVESLVKKMTNSNPSKRPSLAEIMIELVNIRGKVDTAIEQRKATIQQLIQNQGSPCCIPIFSTVLTEKQEEELQNELKGISWNYDQYVQIQQEVIENIYDENHPIRVQFYYDHNLSYNIQQKDNLFII